MQKMKLGIIFGGMSTENEVSIASAKSIIENLDTKKYDIFPIYIEKDGTWYEGTKQKEDKKIRNIMDYLQNMDILFPVLHGLYGEDGTIQGLFELLRKPYVGCGVLASSVGMDKVYTKIIFDRAGLKQAKYEYIRKYKENYILIDKNFQEEVLSIDRIVERIVANLRFPMFIKPSNSG